MARRALVALGANPVGPAEALRVRGARGVRGAERVASTFYSNEYKYFRVLYPYGRVRVDAALKNENEEKENEEHNAES